MTDLTQDEMISMVSSIFDVEEIIINVNDIQFNFTPGQVIVWSSNFARI